MTRQWGGSLHLTFRIFEPGNRAPSKSVEDLKIFLDSDGVEPNKILEQVSFDVARSKSFNDSPDPKRYRERKQIYETVGLIYEDDGRVVVTELGKAARRWIGKLTPANSIVLGRHAAYALSSCQLRTPSRAGKVYDADIEVFPFAFLWRAMLELEYKIRSAELNRALFRVTSLDELDTAIDLIRKVRWEGLADEALGEETLKGAKKNDRAITWVAMASFGWLLLAEKQSGWYTIRPQAIDLLKEAVQIKKTHKEFPSMQEYVRHISRSAYLPKDSR